MAPKPPAKRAKRRLSWKAKLLLISFAFVLLLSVEGIARLAGYGGRPSLFRELLVQKDGEKARIVETNPAAVSIFFPRLTDDGEFMQGSINRQRYRMPKEKGTVRVLYFGESTVEGFPMPRNLASASFMETLLFRSMVGRKVEVLNFGVTAVASFPIRKLAEEAIPALDPDLVVIYAGHNEFYGASGVSSFQKTGSSVWQMELAFNLRRLGVVQALDHFAKTFNKKPPERLKRQLIEVMAGDRTAVEPDGKLHQAARRNLTENFRRVINLCKSQKVPVVICTTASNERDFAPLVSSEVDLKPEQVESFRASLKSASDALTSGSLAVRPQLEKLIAQAPHHAMAHYRFAQALEAAGARDEAAEQYREARDDDGMPWRAGRGMNEAIRKLATETGAVLADCEKSFALEAEGATDWRFMDDHVHPSLRGQALIAWTVFDAVHGAGLLGMDEERVRAIPSWDRLAGELGATPLERYRVINMMTSILQVPPMNLNNEEALRRTVAKKEEMERTADAIEKVAIKNWSTASALEKRALPISYFAAAEAMRQGKHKEARQFLRGAVLNQETLTSPRCAAQLLELLNESNLPGDRVGLLRLWNEYAGEARIVELIPGQPDLLLSYVLAVHSLAAGNEGEAQKYISRCASLISTASDTEKTYMRDLPEPKLIPAVFAPLFKGLQEGAKGSLGAPVAK